MSGVALGDDTSVGVQVGGSVCLVSEWSSYSSVQCVSGGGIVGVAAVVTVGRQSGSGDGLVSDIVWSSGVALNFASSGAGGVSVVGTQYGVEDVSGGVRVGGSACGSLSGRLTALCCVRLSLGLGRCWALLVVTC